jgi:hypothetical protein
MEQRIRRLRRSICVAGLVACTFLAIAFGGLAWIESRAAAQQSDAALDSTLQTVEDLSVAARSEAFERLAIAGRQINAGLHDSTAPMPLDPAIAQIRLQAATYVVGVGATLLHAQSGRFVALADSPRHGDAAHERNMPDDPDAAIDADLRRGRNWSGVLQRNGEWLAVSYRALDPPFGDDVLRLETPLPLREIQHYLDNLDASDTFIVLHDAAGLVRLRTIGAPDALSIDQIEPLLRAQGWVSRARVLGDTELSAVAAYRPFSVARRPLLLLTAAFACTTLSGLLLLRFVWRRTDAEAIAPLRDLGQLAADVQRGRKVYALTQCGRRDEIGVLAGALVQHVHENHAREHASSDAGTPRAIGAQANGPGALGRDPIGAGV